MEMALQFLCARYPQHFRLDKEAMIFHNGILNTESDLRATHPLHILLNNVPEDFAITLRDPTTGYYSFRAGVICSALGWNVASKIGLQLHEIHKPIPDYKEKMQFSMDRYVAQHTSLAYVMFRGVHAVQWSAGRLTSYTHARTLTCEKLPCYMPCHAYFT
jgi:hypothetical protein